MTEQEALQAPVPDQFYKGWTIRWRGWGYPQHQVAITGHWLAWKDDPLRRILAIGVGEKVQEAAYDGVAGWALRVPHDYPFTGLETPAALLAARDACYQRLLKVIDKCEAQEASQKERDQLRAELRAELEDTDNS